MKIWSFQNKTVAQTLRDGHPHHASWQTTWWKDRPYYRAMVQVMHDYGLPTREAPVWAWHGEPDEATICDVGTLLLSSASQNHDLRVLILEAPSHCTFLTDYTQWQDFYLDDRPLAPGRPHPWKDGHDPYAAAAVEQPIQVTLPYLLPEWVIDDRPLPPCLHLTQSAPPRDNAPAVPRS